MGSGASRDGRLDSDSEDDDGLESPRSPVLSSPGSDYQDSEAGTPAPAPRPREPTAGFSTPDPSILMKQLGALNLDDAGGIRRAKLYHYIQGKWLVTAKSVGWQFVRETDEDDEDDEDNADWRSSTIGHKNYKFWTLEVGGVRARVDDQLQMRFSHDQLRVDFVAKGVWALKFPTKGQFQACSTQYEDDK